MSRLTDSAIRQAAHDAEPELRAIVEQKRSLDHDDIVRAMRQAHRRDASIPRLVSERSTHILALEYVEAVH